MTRGKNMKKLFAIGLMISITAICAGMFVRQPETVTIQESTATPQQEVDLFAANDSMEISTITSTTPDLMETIQPEITPNSPTLDIAKSQDDEIETTLALENSTPQPMLEPPSQPKPQTENTSKSGDRNANRDIFVPGFGWIPDNGGGNIVTIAPNAGSGEIVGIMG